MARKTSKRKGLQHTSNQSKAQMKTRQARQARQARAIEAALPHYDRFKLEGLEERRLLSGTLRR